MNIFTMTQNDAESSVFSGLNNNRDEGLYYSSQFAHPHTRLQHSHTRLFDGGMHKSYHEYFGDYVDDYKYIKDFVDSNAECGNLSQNEYYYYVGGYARPCLPNTHKGHFYEKYPVINEDRAYRFKRRQV
jgi:hypothetical protein